MSGIFNLEQMLPELQRAYLSVLRQAEEQEEQRLQRFFQEDGTPRVQTICVPDPLVAGKWRKVDIPLYALAASTSLQIKELTLEFEGKVEGAVGFESTSPPAPTTRGKKSRSRRSKTRSEPAKVRITFKTAPTEPKTEEHKTTTAQTPKVGVDVTLVYAGETLYSHRTLS